MVAMRPVSFVDVVQATSVQATSNRGSTLLDSTDGATYSLLQPSAEARDVGQV